LRAASALAHARATPNDASARGFAKISIKPRFLARIDNRCGDRNANENTARAPKFFVSICFADSATTTQKNFAQGDAKTGRRRVKSIKNERISVR
jgi:hypothetical protein